LRLVFLGTPEFAVPSLLALASGPHPVVGAISQPDRPRGRGQKVEPTAVRAAAERLGIPVLQPEKVGEPAALEWLRALAPDLGVVVAFGQFIPRRVRELPRLGMINAHASLLPRWRGAAPIEHALLSGDTQSGVTIIRVAQEMDSGDWCLRRETPIGPDETAGALAERLAALAADALVEAVGEIAAGTARFQPQAVEGVTLAPKVGRELGALDWSQPAAVVLRRIRAATPRPGADVRLRRSRAAFRILEAELAGGLPAGVRPRAVRAERDRLLVAALDGWISVRRLQVHGRRPVRADEFLRGARLAADEEVVTE
jgi:methionyl-tRNA formyltransferase